MQLPAGFASNGFSYSFNPFSSYYPSPEDITDPDAMPASSPVPIPAVVPSFISPEPAEPASSYSDKLESSLTRHYHHLASYCSQEHEPISSPVENPREDLVGEDEESIASRRSSSESLRSAYSSAYSVSEVSVIGVREPEREMDFDIRIALWQRWGRLVLD